MYQRQLLKIKRKIFLFLIKKSKTNVRINLKYWIDLMTHL